MKKKMKMAGKMMGKKAAKSEATGDKAKKGRGKLMSRLEGKEL